MKWSGGQFPFHVFFPLAHYASPKHVIWRLFVGIFLVFVVWVFSADATSNRPQMTLSIEDIQSPSFSIKGIQVKFAGEKFSQLSLHLGEVVIQERTWRNLNLVCDQFRLTNRLVDCSSGVLHLPGSDPLPVVSHFSFIEQTFDIKVKPTADERWQFSMRWDGDVWQNKLSVTNGQLMRLTPWLPSTAMLPVPSKGLLTGVVTLNGVAAEVANIELALLIDALSFSDSSGLRAGENVNMAVHMNASRQPLDDQWRWQSELSWQDGEVFWQPLYLTGRGHQLHMKGAVSKKNVHIYSGQLDFKTVGIFDFSGVVARPENELIDFNLVTSNLELPTLFDQVINPFLSNTAFADMQVTGQSDLKWRYRDGITKLVVLDLYDVSVIDQRKRFAFHRINGRVPWRKETATIADVGFLSGHVLQIPLGAVRASLEINDTDLRIPQLVVPVLDGKLALENFRATQQADGWRWQFNAALLPISMEKLTDALQIQEMHGTLSGIIPKVSYKHSNVVIDGELSFNVFDGRVTAKRLKLIDPLGLAPHLKVDLSMRDLDLDLLTRTFSFGNMLGRIDMDMKNLELSNWQPIKFDAHLYSSSGNYSRKISQAAIQNISALGGAGAAVAIQRSFMRFFEEFSYSQIGWRCALRHNVCHMGGIESDAENLALQSYTLVKGGGIPAITVMGYNRKVNWQEVINRLKRITEGNGPVIQ